MRYDPTSTIQNAIQLSANEDWNKENEMELSSCNAEWEGTVAEH